MLQNAKMNQFYSICFWGSPHPHLESFHVLWHYVVIKEKRYQQSVT